MKKLKSFFFWIVISVFFYSSFLFPWVDRVISIFGFCVACIAVARIADTEEFLGIKIVKDFKKKKEAGEKFSPDFYSGVERDLH